MYIIKKLFWRVLNIPVKLNFMFRSKVAFPSWQEAEKRVKRTKFNVFTENFENLDLERWKVGDVNDWGSARHDNICVYKKDNIFIKDNILNIQTIKEDAIGKDWDGNPVKSRKVTSGSLNSIFNVKVKTGNTYRAKLRMQDDLGSWKAYWLYNVLGKGYSEIDGFEKFAHDRTKLDKWTFTVHWGESHEKRAQLNRSVRKKFNDWVILDIITTKKLVKIRMNGVLCFISGFAVPDVDMQVIFTDGASTHGGKLTDAQVIDNLPFLMEIDYFKIFNKKLTF